MSSSISKYLGLPDDYKIGFSDASKIVERFKEATNGSDKPISKISFIYYHDKWGDFTKKNNHFNVIVNDMFENLDVKDRFELLTYFSAN